MRRAISAFHSGLRSSSVPWRLSLRASTSAARSCSGRARACSKTFFASAVTVPVYVLATLDSTGALVRSVPRAVAVRSWTRRTPQPLSRRSVPASARCRSARGEPRLPPQAEPTRAEPTRVRPRPCVTSSLDRRSATRDVIPAPAIHARCARSGRSIWNRGHYRQVPPSRARPSGRFLHGAGSSTEDEAFTGSRWAIANAPCKPFGQVLSPSGRSPASQARWRVLRASFRHQSRMYSNAVGRSLE